MAQKSHRSLEEVERKDTSHILLLSQEQCHTIRKWKIYPAEYISESTRKKFTSEKTPYISQLIYFLTFLTQFLTFYS